MHRAGLRDRQARSPPAIGLLQIIALLLAFPAALIAIGLGVGLLPLPYQLFVVLQRLPIIFPLHMIASGLALIVIPIAVFARDRGRVHRFVGRLAAGCVVIGALTALPVALASEAAAPVRAGFFTQGLVWITLLTLAIVAIRRGERRLHARFMIAMAAVASGAIWLRLVMAGAVALTLPFETAYATAAWVCWLLPLAIALAIATPRTSRRSSASDQVESLDR